MRKRPGERQEPWLLIKATDEFARKKSDPDILEEMPDSAASGRTMDEIAARQETGLAFEQQPRRSSPRRPRPAAKIAAPRGAEAARHARHGAKPRPSAAARSPARSRARAKARLPDFVPPCLATLSSTAPDSGDWVHEIKFDGYRIQAASAAARSR